MSGSELREGTKRERGILVGVRLRGQEEDWSLDASLDELAELAATAGVSVAARISQRLDRPDPATLIGSGKVEEVKALAQDLGADVVLFDRELSPRQQRNLEKALDIKLIDRTALILDIFAGHARSREGMLQVELAQMEYRLPRLTRLWTHLARQAGGRGGAGGVGVRGPGETQLEIDKREIGRRITALKEQITSLKSQRRGSRKNRQRSGLPLVGLVGYTNAGKSTLLNRLTGADAYAADQLFATLDPTTRRLSLPSGRTCLITDTVGFIQNLPTQLVAAFSATLEELEEVDILLHVVDVTHPQAVSQAQTVEGVIHELGLGERGLVAAANKVDLLDDALDPVDARAVEDTIALLREVYPDLVTISAQDGRGLEALLGRLEGELRDQLVPVSLRLPFDQTGILARIRGHGELQREAYLDDGIAIEALVPRYLLGELAPFGKDA